MSRRWTTIGAPRGHVAEALATEEGADGQPRLVLACACGWRLHLRDNDTPMAAHARHVGLERLLAGRMETRT